MKKIFFAVILVVMFSSVSYGAISQDIYVRQDVFEMYMKHVDAKLDMIIEELKSQREDIKELREEVKDLSDRMVRLEGRMDGLD